MRASSAKRAALSAGETNAEPLVSWQLRALHAATGSGVQASIDIKRLPVAVEVPAEPPAVDTASADTAAVDAARDLKIGLDPAVAGARRIKGGRR